MLVIYEKSYVEPGLDFTSTLIVLMNVRFAFHQYFNCTHECQVCISPVL